jgi:hypothetical protein
MSLGPKWQIVVEKTLFAMSNRNTPVKILNQLNTTDFFMANLAESPFNEVSWNFEDNTPIDYHAKFHVNPRSFKQCYKPFKNY